MNYRNLFSSLKRKCPVMREYADSNYWSKLTPEEKEYLSKFLVEFYTGKGSHQDKRRNQFDFKAVRSSLEDMGEAI